LRTEIYYYFTLFSHYSIIQFQYELKTNNKGKSVNKFVQSEVGPFMPISGTEQSSVLFDTRNQCQ